MRHVLFLLLCLSFIGFLFPLQTNAQQYTTSQCVTTDVGKPPSSSGACGNTTAAGGSGNQVADYTIQLADAIIKACPPGNRSSIGHVNFSDNGCQNSLRKSRGGAFEDKVIDQFQRMPLQCIMFVYGIALHFNKPILLVNAVAEGKPQPGYDWYPVSRYGLGDLRPGDFMVYQDNTLSSFNPGHMAIVVGVNASKRTYDIIDGNWDFYGSVFRHTVPWAQSNGIISMMGWLRMK